MKKGPLRVLLSEDQAAMRSSKGAAIRLNRKKLPFNPKEQSILKKAPIVKPATESPPERQGQLKALNV
jgi:hypothetical protein